MIQGEKGIGGKKYLILIFLVLVSFFTIRFIVVGYGVGGDGEWYYSYLPSLIIDHDLNFENQYLLSPWRQSSNKFMDKNATIYSWDKRLSERTSTGYVPNPFPIGSAVLWFPFFFLSLILISFINILGFNISLDGYSSVSQYITMIGSIFYAVLGMLLANRLIGRFNIEQKNNNLAIFLILFGTFAIQYFAIEPSMSHANDFFITTLFFYYFYNYLILTNNEVGYVNWILFGLICSLMVMVRPQNSIFLILPIINYLDTVVERKDHPKRIVKDDLINCCLISFSFLISVSPLLLSWKIIYGSFITIPQGSDFLHYLSPQVVLLLFSFNHGLLTATPLLFFSLIGFILLMHENWMRGSWVNRKFLTFLSLAFLQQLYINSIVTDWWASDSFGSRRFTGLMFIFMFGLAFLLERIYNKKFSYIIYFLFSILIIFNIIYLIEYNTMIIPRSGIVTYMDIINKIFIILS